MKIAVILFNLGGPDKLESVKPFLNNLFSDPAILSLPSFIRKPLAWLISTKREKEAQDIYRRLGGKSPLFENTEAQADALEKALGSAYKAFICMRYWHPMTEEVVKKVRDYNPDQIILLPLYPQFSTTTTGSSFKEWHKYCYTYGVTAPTHQLGCYPEQPGFIEAVVDLVNKELGKLSEKEKTQTRILFTAHGLPQKIVDRGDPYQYQVEQTVEKIRDLLSGKNDLPDSIICYQSRVGPVEWIKPYTDEEIIRAGQEGKRLIVVPVAFVSEHSETLVELDMDYEKLAEDSGVLSYARIPTVSTHPKFIQGLAKLVQAKPVVPEIWQECHQRNQNCGCKNLTREMELSA